MIKIDSRFRVVAILFPVLLGILAQWLLLRKPPVERDLTQFLVIWGIAIIIFIFLAKPLMTQKGNTKSQNPNQRKIPVRIEVALFIIVLAVGIFFRLYQLETIPAGLNHDAAWNGLYAIKITQGEPYVPYVPDKWGRETMFHYIIAFYQILIGPEKLAINLAAATVGILTLVMFYFLIRLLFNTETALVSTLLLGVSGWHLTFSKVGWRIILVPLFTCLTFYFIVKAVKELHMRDFILAGLFLGLSLDTYNAARIIPFIVVVYLLYENKLNPGFLHRSFKQLAIFVLIAAVAFAPLGWYAINNWDIFNGRTKYLFIGSQIEREHSIQPLLNNVKNAFLLFNMRGNADDFFIEDPLLDSPISVFFVFGLSIACYNWRKRPYFLLLSSLVLTLLVGIISIPSGVHNIGLIIPAIAFAGLFVTNMWTWFSESFIKYKKIISGCFLLVLLLITHLAYQEYLGPNRRIMWGFFPDATPVGLYMKKIAPDYEIYAAAVNWPRDVLTYLSYQGTGDPFKWAYNYTFNASEFLSLPPSTIKGTAFIMEDSPENQPVFEKLSQRFESTSNDTIYFNRKLVANVLLLPPNATVKQNWNT
jgi:hypothetical protein